MGTQLGKSDDAGAFVRELFLQRLPSNVRMVLASADSKLTIEQLADMADKVLEVATPPSSIAAISRPQGDDVQSDLKQLKQEVARLTNLVTTLTTASRNRARSRSREPRPRRQPTPAPGETSQGTGDTLCWYHDRFGADAHKCQEPCSWGNLPAGR